MNDYNEFLESKRIVIEPSGFSVDLDDLNPMLFDWQKAIVRWALARGKSALFEDCGLGKTPQQLEWAKWVVTYTGNPVLILAPLAVANQTQREGDKFGIPVTVCETQDDVDRRGVNITNYEKLHHFKPAGWGGIVLDESSILKGYDGKTRKALNKFARKIPYRLCCTATPAPNDLIELANHAEFLDIMNEKEIKALFFTQDGNTTHNWRLKGHAKGDFWKWMAEWSVAIRYPSDLGYDDDGFILPELRMHEVTVDGATMDGWLVPVVARTLSERRQARRESLEDRVKVAADLVNNSTEPWLIWCDLNKESDALRRAIPDAIEVAGRHSNEHKRDAMLGFSDGRYRVIVTKPTIAGHGMNWQHCNNMAFVGLSDSYEQQYQAIRRCWRFMQTKPVDVHVITATTEGAVVVNIKRKEQQAAMMFEEIVKRLTVHSELSVKAVKDEMIMEYEMTEEDGWSLSLGDSIYTAQTIESNSIGLTVFSPPFPGMYAYTNSTADMGNSKGINELVDHFNFLIPELLRITKPGRLCAIHLTQEPIFKRHAGYVGRRDFRGEVIRRMERVGWIYWSEVTIDKNPQLKASRTKEHTLLFKTLAKDSTSCAPALADYLLVFKKKGDNETPVRAGISETYNNPNGWMTNDDWIEWAAPVWYGNHRGLPGGIRESDVLNVRQARETDDERHLAPLQLGVIERCVKLWSAPGDLVYDPFTGIGSTGYVALKYHRQFIGGELKRSYYESAIQNLRRAVREREQPTLFDWAVQKQEAEKDG
jgi:DNA modification methylase